jgi:hypothetical protein
MKTYHKIVFDLGAPEGQVEFICECSQKRHNPQRYRVIDGYDMGLYKGAIVYGDSPLIISITDIEKDALKRTDYMRRLGI